MTVADRTFADDADNTMKAHIESPNSQPASDYGVLVASMIAAAAQATAAYAATYESLFLGDMVAMKAIELFRKDVNRNVKNIRQALDNTSQNGG